MTQLHPSILDQKGGDPLPERTRDRAGQTRTGEHAVQKEVPLRSIVESFPFACYVVDNRSDAIIHFNHRFCEIWGLESLENRVRQGEVKRSDLLSYCLPLVQDLAGLAISRTLLEKEDHQAAVESEIPLADGRVLRRISTPVWDEEGNRLGRLCLFQDITEHQKAEAEHRRRDAILKAVGFASQQFLQCRSWEEVIQEVLKRLGEAAGVSRTYIFKNYSSQDGRLLTSLRYEWADSGIATRIDDPELLGIPLEQGPIARWEEALRRGEVVCGQAEDLPPCEREAMARQGIQTLVVVPIFTGQSWWGLMRLDDCRRERQWSETEKEALMIAARLLGTSIQHSEMEQALQQSERREASEQLLAEESLRRSEERFRRLAENAPDIILMYELHPERRFSYVNPATTMISGYSPEEFYADPYLMWKLVVPEDQPVFRTFMEGKAGHSAVLRWRHKEGHTVWVELRDTLFHDAEGELVAIEWIVRDITEQKRLQEQLLGDSLLETAGRVAGQVAHDFNNLLSPLISYLELMKVELPEGHPARRYCDIMIEAVSRMADINADMLALGRRGRTALEPVDLSRLVLEALSQRTVTPGTFVLDLELAPDLLPVAGSPAQLFRMLANLLANAEEAMPEGGTLAVSTDNVWVVSPPKSGPEAGEYVMLEVADTGCGIPPEDLERIFEAFFTTKRTGRWRGSGLGLSVVQAVAEDHGGWVEVESQVGKGSSFRVYLPAAREGLPQQVGQELRGGAERILVVDDEPMQREVVARLLEKAGYQVEAVGSGEEALEYLLGHSVDLLVLDLAMAGGLDGAETYRRVLEVRPGQRAILISGFAEAERVEKAERLGAGEFLSKPLSLLKLARAVRRELDREKNLEV